MAREFFVFLISMLFIGVGLWMAMTDGQIEKLNARVTRLEDRVEFLQTEYKVNVSHRT